MADAKHTPGPWICDNREAPDPIKITTPWRLQNRKIPIALVDADWSYPLGEEQEANARLIAAAPDLLEALKGLSFAAQTSGGTAGRDEHLVEAIGIAERAIAKATGDT